MPVTMCVYCRQRPADTRWQPFCSERCRLADLGRWLQGDYRVTGSSIVPDEADSSDIDDDPSGRSES
ncbi:MAG: DNA gyrase inhibitor YacG [Vicinamibacterales bacterium]|jgi:endogenous inhibitor of DNA gyrase (YacG/DUF329 family)